MSEIDIALDRPVSDLEITQECLGLLLCAIPTVRDLVQMREEELREMFGMNERHVTEVKDVLSMRGLSLGMLGKAARA